MARDDAVVVEPQQRDHVEDVCVGLDPARSVARLAGKDRVVVDPVLVEVDPDLLGEAEVGDMIAVQVAELAPSELERVLPRAPGPASTPGHEVTSAVIRSSPSRLAHAVSFHRCLQDRGGRGLAASGNWS